MMRRERGDSGLESRPSYVHRDGVAQLRPKALRQPLVEGDERRAPIIGGNQSTAKRERASEARSRLGDRPVPSTASDAAGNRHGYLARRLAAILDDAGAQRRDLVERAGEGAGWR